MAGLAQIGRRQSLLHRTYSFLDASLDAMQNVSDLVIDEVLVSSWSTVEWMDMRGYIPCSLITNVASVCGYARFQSA
jgi:hypothetical protein